LDSCIQQSDYVGGTLDITLTIMRAQKQVPHGTGLELELTQGKTYTAQSQIDVIRPLKLHVNGAADRDVSGATIQWTAGYTGIGMGLHYPGTYAPDPAAGSLLTMRGINIQGPGYLTGGSGSHGILAHTRFVIEHCQIQNWCGDGLHIDNPTL